MKKVLLVIASLLFFTGLNANTAEANIEKLKSIANGEHRSEANRKRNSSRNPVETLSFFGIKDNMTVVELSPGGGWYTEILAPYLKDKGQYVAAGFDEKSEVKYYARSAKMFSEKLAADKDNYGKVSVGIMEPPKKMAYAKPNSADMIVTFRNTHSWLRRDNADVVFKSIFETLKPNGVLGLVQHRANKGQKFEKGKMGYIPEEEVIKLAEKAGLKLVARSEVNANPKDTKNYEKGVWSLPPALALGDKDKEKYLAIGESDRMTLKFVKPAS